MAEEEQFGAPVDIDEKSWFDGWLTTGTVAQRSVPVYGRPDLFAKYEDLERRREVLAQVEDSEERTLGDSRVSDIDEQMESLYKEWQSSKTTWYIRALNPDEIDEIRDACDFPDGPEKDASADEKRSYERDLQKANDKANSLMVCRSLVKIENDQDEVVAESITVDQVEVMRKNIGASQILRLVGAAMVAATQETSIPVPLSARNSRSDRG